MIDEQELYNMWRDPDVGHVSVFGFIMDGRSFTNKRQIFLRIHENGIVKHNTFLIWANS